MVQVGRRRGAAGRQSVRDRNRQGIDGSAGDRSRRAKRNPRSGRRNCTGRRRGRHHRRRGRQRLNRAEVCTSGSASTEDAGSARHGCTCTRSTPAACRSTTAANQARSVLRGAHASAQFRTGATVGRSNDHATGTAARERSRHRSVTFARLRRAWPDHGPRRGKCTATGRAWRDRRRPERRSGQGALRSGELPGNSARRHAQDHRRAAGAGEADHPALLSDHGHHHRSPDRGARRGQCRSA